MGTPNTVEVLITELDRLKRIESIAKQRIPDLNELLSLDVDKKPGPKKEIKKEEKNKE